MNNTKHDYLVALIKELEKENNSVHLSTFWAKVEGELKMRKKLQGYIDLPISQEQYDTLIASAEHLLGVEHKEPEVNPFITNTLISVATDEQRKSIHIYNPLTDNPLAGSITHTTGRTNDATSVESASDFDEELYAFTAKQDIKKGDFVLIDKDNNQSITSAAEMEVSPATLQDLFDEFELKHGQPDYKVETVDVKEGVTKLSDQLMDEYKDAYAALASHDDGYYSGALYNLDDVKKAMEHAQEGYKTIWYYEPFEQYFVGNIRDKTDFPFIYLNDDPSHSDYVKHTPVVGPFNSMKELDDYFGLMVHEGAGIDGEFINILRGLIVMIKHYESKDDAHNYSTIIDKLWENLKSFLLGNI